MPTCSKCNIDKDPKDFYKRKDTKKGIRNECKVCRRPVTQMYYLKNKPEYYKRNLKNVYYTTYEYADNLKRDQDYKCAVCKETPNKPLHLDHCHKTGKIRGFLCRDCNLLLGFAKDNVNTLKEAVKYLFQSKDNN